MRCQTCVALLVGALLWTPTLSWAQDGPTEEPTPKQPEAADPAEAAPTEVAPTEGEPEVVPTEGEPAAQPAATGDGTTPAQPTGPVLGPGGRELRTDYPGVDDAMKARMDVESLQGIDTPDKAPKEVYDLRVRELETRIDDLKAKVFRSKSRIVLLRETLLGGKTAASRAVIVHKDQLGSSYKLRRALYRLDGNTLLNELDRDGSLSEKENIELYSGSIGPGTHNLTVYLEYQGNSSMFSYFQGYDFTLQKSCKFTVEQGKTSNVSVIPHEKGNATTQVQDRPDVRCESTVTEIRSEELLKEQDKDAKKK